MTVKIFWKNLHLLIYEFGMSEASKASSVSLYYVIKKKLQDMELSWLPPSTILYPSEYILDNILYSATAWQLPPTTWKMWESRASLFNSNSQIWRDAFKKFCRNSAPVICPVGLSLPNSYISKMSKVKSIVSTNSHWSIFQNQFGRNMFSAKNQHSYSFLSHTMQVETM